MRPKREIHPPPSKDLGYEGPNSARKPKRRNDPQLQWAARTIGSFEKTQKYFDIVSPFLYPIEQVIVAIPEYKTIIKQPIDLLIIKQRLDDGVYEEVDHVDRDIRLLVSNATTFNPPGDAVYNAANALQQLWTEKKQAMPPKPAPEARAASEEAPEDLDDSDDEDKDGELTETVHSAHSLVARLKEAKAERATLDREIADLEAKIARKPKRKTKAPKPAKPRPSKSSPNVNGNGAAKKARKPKEQASYRDDDDSDDEVQTITITQKQELAEKIQVAEAETLEAAVRIIQSTTQISGVSASMGALESTLLIHLRSKRSSWTLTLSPPTQSSSCTTLSAAASAARRTRLRRASLALAVPPAASTSTSRRRRTASARWRRSFSRSRAAAAPPSLRTRRTCRALRRSRVTRSKRREKLTQQNPTPHSPIPILPIHQCDLRVVVDGFNVPCVVWAM
jgi:hypothetical protein